MYTQTRIPVMGAQALFFLLSLFLMQDAVADEGLPAFGFVDALADAMCDKQVVLLGELPSHGEKLGFQAKAALVKKLVQSCGFEALYFEAPVYDFLGLQQAVAAGTARQVQLQDAIGRFWKTRSLHAWRGWLFEQNVQGRLGIFGLDDQLSITSNFARKRLPELVAGVLDKPQRSECQARIERNLFWRYDAKHAYDAAEKQGLLQCATAAHAAVQTHAERSDDVLMLENLANLYARDASVEGALDRDATMHRNLLQQPKSHAAQKKAIVWTATVHSALRQGPLPHKPLGARLVESLGRAHIGSVAFSALAGESSRAGGPVQPIESAPDGSLEAGVKGAHSGWKVFDAQALNALGSVSSRVLGSVHEEHWAQFFDFIVVFEKEQAPVFE